jgi:hypothetical protein
MYQLCPHCRERLEFSGPAPKFCSSCGQPLGPRPTTAVIDADADAPTLPPPEAIAETLAPDTPEEWLVGTEPKSVGKYDLLRRLGGGGMGTVYEAVDKTTGLHVALKLIQPEYAGSAESVERFRQEGALASQLSHPRCVFVLEANEDRGRPYIVMELMTGATLHDLVRERGPLPEEEAIRKILDVIEGLQEAHGIGLVHRDVKPGNCFLEADGRVKIGDFGLAKSLLRDAHLTRTGTFLGTPLFASPEQIKKEVVDAQSDVYSVAATLYYLLTAKAPFETGDSMATLARIVSDDPPSMRSLRPEISKALDEIVMRGLARERRNRWRNLQDFRMALLGLLPAEVSAGGLWLRFGAILLDLLLLKLGEMLVALSLAALTARLGVESRPSAFSVFTTVLPFIAYFALLEGLLGWSLGKRILRLRVGTPSRNRPPGVGRALIRAAVLYFVVMGPRVAINIAYTPAGPQPATEVTNDKTKPQAEQDVRQVQGPEFGLSEFLDIGAVCWLWLSLALLPSTMRRRNGYRGLHELASGTRTYSLRWYQSKDRLLLGASATDLDLVEVDGLPERIGSYRIHGALLWAANERTLLGNDVQLGRSVWIWMRPVSQPPLNERSRLIHRTSRLRWAAGGRHEDWEWDAFVTAPGSPLPPRIAECGPLSWARFRPTLEELTQELLASHVEHTLPALLSIEQVWIGSNGHVRLHEMSLRAHTDTGDNGPSLQPEATDESRALALLADTTVLALEGTSARTRREMTPVRAPLPLHATQLVNRLVLRRPSPDQRPYETLEELHADLAAIHEDATELTRVERAKHLFVHSVCVFFGVMALTMFGTTAITWAVPRLGLRYEELGLVAVGVSALSLFFLPAFLFRGGLSYARSGIAIVRANGRRASRLHCLGRAVVAWSLALFFVAATVVAFSLVAPNLGYSEYATDDLSDFVWTNLPLNTHLVFLLTTPLLGIYGLLLLIFPTRTPHDFIVRTYLVPK